jgi:hypothetical protein
MKQLQRDLNFILKSLKALMQRVEKMQSKVKSFEKPQAPKIAKGTKTVANKPANEKTAYATVLGIINKRKKGITVEELMDKTGFNRKKIANLIFKARKQGKIKSEERGTYLKA